jgi:hypothetical protein
MQGAGKVIATAGGNNQNGHLQLHKRWQVAVDGSVPAEKEDRVSVLRGCGKAERPACMRAGLEGCERAWRATESEDSGGTHEPGI